ncbi:MAG TPA: hypothetical protein VIX73_37855 [Kofleriaceae bacterium]
MTRFAVLVMCVAACSKSAGNQDKVSSPPAATGGDVIAVPKGPPPNMPGASAQPAAPATNPPGPAADEDRMKLKPEEGTLAVIVPPDAKAGAEAVARVTVTPGKGYHVNTEYPTKLQLTPPSGVTLPKAEFTAGGHDKAKGDAAELAEQGLVFAVKLTPTASGSYTINGKFKFAVCDASQCLPKKEAIAITVAAK